MDLLSLKLYVAVAYILFGALCLYAARADAIGHSLKAFSLNRTQRMAFPLMMFAAPLLAAYIAFDANLLLFAASITTVFVAWDNRAQLSVAPIIASLAVCILTLSLVWWRFGPSPLQILPLALFLSTLAVVFFGLRRPAKESVLPLYVVSLVFVAAGALFLLNLSPFRPGQSSIVFLVHHWGAFIGPALHLKAGLIPFYDIPLQYGLGPTLAIAATCNDHDCWRGAHALFASFHLIEALLVLSMVLASTRHGWARTAAASLVVFAAAFLWPGLASEGSLLIATPSVGGFRFLPVTLVAWLFFFQRPALATIAMGPGLLWSPESAAMCLAVYGICGTQQFGLLKAVLTCAALSGFCFAALVVVHRLTYGVWIDPNAFLEYVLHVPSPLPIRPLSDILLLGLVFILGGWLVVNAAADPRDRRRDLVAAVLLFAVTIYVLGRSHPNNVCNLAPFIVLVAFRAFARQSEDAAPLRDATRLGFAVFVAALAFSQWNVVPWNGGLVTDIHTAVAGYPSQEPDVMAMRAKIPPTPGLGIADFGPNFARYPKEQIVWTPMDPSSLWSFVPDDRRQIYVERSAKRLKRAGWAIFAESQLFLLKDLQVAYTIHGLQHLDGPVSGSAYIVACFEPKFDVEPESATAKTPSSARCPSDTRLSPSTQPGSRQNALLESH